MKTISRLLLLFFAFALLTSVPAAAQCNPSYDPECLDGGDDLAPDVGFNPAGGSYTVASGATQDVSVTISFSDASGLRAGSLKILKWHGGTSSAITSFSWTLNENGTFATSKGTLRLSAVGETVLTAEITDNTGKIGSGRASFHLAYSDPSVPVVSLAPHHNDFRDTSLGASVLTYSMPPYMSMDVPRSLGLYYDSQRANPTGFVQLDVETGPLVKAVTLHIVDQATNTGMTSEDAWTRDPSGKQRLGAQWSMRDRPTGAYMFWADVRAYLNDDVTVKLTRVPFRVLVVNERFSRYGAGWVFAGIQRMHPTSAGLLVDEGNGVVRWFEKLSCGTASCSFRTPAGDFSKMEYLHSDVPRYVRTYVDGTTVTFSTAGVTTSVSDRFGRATRYDWAAVDSPVVWVLVKVTDPAQIPTWFEYFDGNVKAIIDPAGRRVEMSYAGNLTRISGPTTLDVQYDTLSRVTSYTDPRGTWDIAYDAFGAVRQLTAPAVTVAGGTSVRPVTTYRSLQATTVLGSWATHICCNWAAPVPANAVMTTATDPLGHVTQAMLDRYGNPVKVIDVAGRTTTTVYNDHGLPTESNDGHSYISYTWNDNGQLLSKMLNMALVYHASYGSGPGPDLEMTGGAATWYRYGPRGEVVRTWHGHPEDEFRNGTSYEYDSSYRLVGSVAPEGERTEWAYTGNPWLNTSEVRLVRADGTRLVTKTSYAAAGRPETVTTPENRSTTTSYDALNRPVQVIDPLGGASRYTYTGLDLTSFTDATGKLYRWTWNALGWLMTETFPDGKTRQYAYNADGQRTSSTDRRNLTVTFQYDNAHRVVSRAADGVTATFTYPDIHTVEMKNDVLTETVRMHPEAFGRLHTVRYSIGIHAYEIERLYDRMNGWTLFGIDVKRSQSGSLLKTDTIRYTPDYHPGDLSFAGTVAVRDFSGSTSILGFDSSGRHTRTAFPNGVTQNHFYETDGRRKATTYSSAVADLALGAEYTYDSMNRISTRTAMTGDKRWTYGYDALGRVSQYWISQLQTSASCNPSIETCDRYWEITSIASYTYDAVGNRTDSGGTLQASSNRYAIFNGFTLEYDAEGNVTRKYRSGFDQRFTWNALGRLASVTTNGVAVTYGYAPSGRRVRRTAGGVSSWFIYDDDDVILELDNSADPVRAYTHLPGIDLPLSVRTTSSGTATTQYYTLETPGHVTGLLDTSGGLAAQLRYVPFGEVESQSGTSVQPLRFMAREVDSGTGLYYVRNRWYDPALARFVSEDPVGLADGPNSYAYAGNDPVNRRDPSGLDWGLKCFKDPLDGVILFCWFRPPWADDPGDPWKEPKSIIQFKEQGFFNGVVPNWLERYVDKPAREVPVQVSDAPVTVHQSVDCFTPAPEVDLLTGRDEYLVIGYANALDILSGKGGARQESGSMDFKQLLPCSMH